MVTKILQNHWANYLINVIGTGLLFLSFFYMAQFTFYKVMPTSYWFEYEYIKPTKLVFLGTEEITFATSYEFKRAFFGQAQHRLWCNQVGSIENFSLYSNQTNNFGQVKAKVSLGSFIYSKEKPNPPRTCFLKSTIIATLPFGVTKTFEYVGSNFNIVDKSDIL